MINFEHQDDLEQYVEDNIIEINEKPGQFSEKNVKKDYDIVPTFTDTDIKPYLANKLSLYVRDNRTTIEEELHAINNGNEQEINEQIKSYANRMIFLYEDVRNYYELLIYENIRITFQSSRNYRNTVLERLLRYVEYADRLNSNSQINYIKKGLEDSVNQALDLALSNGFTKNLTNIDSGVKAANEGDSGQFMFLARAILAGFNCSNVDVRSSRYDAVIDYKGKILRVQVKGISDSKATIQLKDRDRAGSGNDPTNEKNKGKYITAEDIDIYVAVDKKFGICYIIPATQIEAWGNETTSRGNRRSTVPMSRVIQYRENWNIISEVATALYGDL